MSNYPPGVTGLEYAIAGADEQAMSRALECEGCGFDGDVDGTLSSYGDDAWFDAECPGCGRQVRQDLFGYWADVRRDAAEQAAVDAWSER